MARFLGLIGLVVLAVAVVATAFYAYQALMLRAGRTPEGYQILTVVPGASGFEPSRLPDGPVLESQSARDLALNFGYAVGGVAHAYSLVLAFPRESETGRAVVTARVAGRSASSECEATRRWDEPRHAYSVALSETFTDGPDVPALCMKAVIGPSKAGYELKDASICVARRDAAGQCHPETLACGLIRP